MGHAREPVHGAAGERSRTRASHRAHARLPGPSAAGLSAARANVRQKFMKPSRRGHVWRCAGAASCSSKRSSNVPATTPPLFDSNSGTSACRGGSSRRRHRGSSGSRRGGGSQRGRLRSRRRCRGSPRARWSRRRSFVCSARGRRSEGQASSIWKKVAQDGSEASGAGRTLAHRPGALGHEGRPPSSRVVALGNCWFVVQGGLRRLPAVTSLREAAITGDARASRTSVRPHARVTASLSQPKEPELTNLVWLRRTG